MVSKEEVKRVDAVGTGGWNKLRAVPVYEYILMLPCRLACRTIILLHCVDYIHRNPRKHKLVGQVRDYPWSSFHRFVKLGQYNIHWGGSDPDSSVDEDWGEP